MGSVGHRHRKGSMNADGRKLLMTREEGCLSVGGGVGEGESERGSVELKDLRRERYCRKVVDGVEPLEAWYLSFCDEEGKERIKRSSALSARFKTGNLPEVQERMRYLSEHPFCSDGDGDGGSDDDGDGGDGGGVITKKRKRAMLDSLLEKTYEVAMSEGASAKDVSACLDVMARHDMVHGDVVKPKLEVVFPQLDAIFGGAALRAVEGRLGIEKKSPVVDI